MADEESTAERIASALELIDGSLTKIADMLEYLARCTGPYPAAGDVEDRVFRISNIED